MNRRIVYGTLALGAILLGVWLYSPGAGATMASNHAGSAIVLTGNTGSGNTGNTGSGNTGNTGSGNSGQSTTTTTTAGNSGNSGSPSTSSSGNSGTVPTIPPIPPGATATAAGLATGIIILWVALALVGLAALVFSIIAIVDAAKRPDYAYQVAGANKALWIVLIAVLELFCGVGWIVALIYWFSVRPKLKAAEQGGAFPGYGAPPGGMPQSGGYGPFPGYGPPPTSY